VRLARIYVAPDEQRFDGRLGARSRGLEDRRWPWSPVDASGHVRFENLAVGRPLDVFIDRGPFGSFGPDGPSRWPQPRVVLTAGETRQLEVRLKAWAAVHGRVVGATTPPVRVAAASFGAKLSLSLDSLSSAEQKSRTVRWFGNVLVQCDDDGTFAIDQLVPGRIELTAVGADGATLAGTTLELNEGELRTGVELVVDRQKVVCQVTRAGKPVAKAAVQCDDANPIERARPLFTDDGGRCELLVANAPFTVTARMRGEETSRHFDAPPADAIELELGVRPRADVPSLVGRVVADTARGAAPPVVTAIRHDAVECTRDAVVVVAANPKFSLNGLAAGTWDLVVTAGGRVASLAGIAVQSGATTDLGDVALTSGATLDVTLAVDGTSAPPTADADASLLVRRGEVRLALVKLAPGELARLVLPAGKATLELRRDGQWLDAREVVVAADQGAAVVFGAK
jgi:hypothetical protein